MNLPHLAPIKFAQEVLCIDENKAHVICEFTFFPTLSMIAEAAAQSTSVFSKNDECSLGFLVLLKDIVLFEDIENLTYIIHVEKIASFGVTIEFYFELYEQEKLNQKIASGNFIISMSL